MTLGALPGHLNPGWLCRLEFSIWPTASAHTIHLSPVFVGASCLMLHLFLTSSQFATWILNMTLAFYEM